MNYANNQLEEVAGYALNGITSVGRVSDTALRIRLAAQNQGRNGQRFLTARTHNIFVVVISPFDREKPYATKRVTLRSQYEFRRVNGGAIAQPQGAADSGVDIAVTLAADDYVSFKTSDKPAPTPSFPALQLSAFEPDGTKPSKLAVNLPAWDAHYLGDLRALVKDCNGGIQLAEMSKDDFGKALKVSFLRPTAKSDIPACKTTSSEVTVIVERARLGGFPDVAVVANVILPATKGAANSKGETTSADAEPSAVPKSCAAIAGAFVRAEHLVIDAAGRGALQALVSLKNGKENKYTGATPLIPQYLLVQGADAVSVVPVAGVASPAIKSRTQLTQSTRYAITLQNAVPHRPVIIDFATLKGEDFVVGHRCSVMPVLLHAPTARHAP